MLCMYGLHSIHRQFSRFHFLSSFLKQFIVVNFLFSREPYYRFKTQGMKYFLYHERDCEPQMKQIQMDFTSPKFYFAFLKNLTYYWYRQVFTNLNISSARKFIHELKHFFLYLSDLQRVMYCHGIPQVNIFHADNSFQC